MKIDDNSGNSELFRVTGSQVLWREDGARKEDETRLYIVFCEYFGAIDLGRKRLGQILVSENSLFLWRVD